MSTESPKGRTHRLSCGTRSAADAGMATGEIHIGVLVAGSPATPIEALEAFASRVTDEVSPALDDASGIQWRFHREQPSNLSDERSRRPSDFLGEASLRMVEGPYDAVVVLTDVGLLSERQQLVPGLVSEIARVIVISTRDLRVSPHRGPLLPLDSERVHWNAAALLLHLIGHAAGLRHEKGAEDVVMSPFSIDDERRSLPRFSDHSRERLPGLAAEFPEREDLDQGFISEITFHVSSAARHPWQLLRAVVRSRAPLLPFRLPRLSTAAVAPALILVFTAEIWDAGFHMTNAGVWGFASISLVASAIYLPFALELLLPRKENRLNTEHLAVVNVSVLISITLAVIGLFVMLMLLTLFIQILIFPPDLIREWPSLALESKKITFVDHLRIAALISTIGVLTGALAGGLESRDVLRHLSLFRRRP